MAVMLDENSVVAHAMASPQQVGRSAVLLDTQPLMLEIVERVLDSIDVTTLAKHTTPEAALEAIRTQQPDLFIVELPGGGADAVALESIREARALVPGIKPIVLAVTSDARTVEAAFDAGAVAAVSRTSQRGDLALAVRQAFEPSIYIAYAFGTSPTRAQPDPRGPGGELTKREREILQLVAEGYSNSRVARLLWVTVQTVKFHLSNIYRKLEVENRTEASRWAQRNGLLPDIPTDLSA